MQSYRYSNPQNPRYSQVQNQQGWPLDEEEQNPHPQQRHNGIHAWQDHYQDDLSANNNPFPQQGQHGYPQASRSPALSPPMEGYSPSPEQEYGRSSYIQEKPVVNINQVPVTYLRKPKHQWRPYIHHLSSFIILCLICLGLIGFIEWTVRRLPNTDFGVKFSPEDELKKLVSGQHNLKRRDLAIRQGDIITSMMSVITATAATAATTTVSSTSTSTTSEESVITGVPNSSTFLDDKITTSSLPPAPPPPPSSFVDPGVTIIAVPTPETAPAAPQGNGEPPSPLGIFPNPPAGESKPDPGSGGSPNPVGESPSPPASDDTSSNPSSHGSPGSSSSSSDDSSHNSNLGGASNLGHADTYPTAAPGAPGSTPSPSTRPGVAPSSTFVGPDITTASASTYVSVGVMTVAVDSSMPIPTSLPPGVVPVSITSNGRVFLVYTVSSTVVGVATSTGSTGKPTGAPDPKDRLTSDREPTFIAHPQNYFMGVYLPIILAVVLRMMIGYLYDCTKMMDPFYQLSRPDGVPAKDFFWINYLSANDTLAPLWAMLSGHWVMLWTSITYLAVQIMSTFSSELIRVRQTQFAVKNAVLFGASLWINVTVARIIQGFLAGTCVMLISIYFLLRNHRSGVYSDPSSVASIASLIHHPETTRDFKDLDPLAPKKKLLKQLSGRRYRLESYIAPNGLERYGIVSTADSGPEHRNAQYTSLDQARMPPLEKKSKKSHMINIGMNLVLTISIVGLLTLITYYTQTSSGPFEDFMDSQNFGPRFLLTVVGIIIKAQWSRLERLAAANAPLEKLYNPTPSGSVRSTILAQRTLNPISTVGVALANSNPFAALLGFTALLAEILIILLPGVPFSSGQLYTWARATWYTCMALLGFMCIVMIAVWAKFRVSWPKQPNTIGAMAVYLADSILAEELAPLATASEKEREAAVLGWGRDCELRRWRERDGREKWTIDFEGAR